MIFVIDEDDYGNAIVYKASSAGKSDEPIIFLTEGVTSKIKDTAKIVAKLVGIIGYISRNVPLQDAVEEYTDLLTMPSKSLDNFAKSMEDLMVEVKENKNALRDMYASKRKNKDGIRIQTRQQGGTIKYKRYELRIYSRCNMTI